MSSLGYDFINFDFPHVENQRGEEIYTCLTHPSTLTVVIGAKCSDGITLIADRKLTRRNGEVCFNDKIFGDIEHILIGYTGDADLFDIFRRYTVGDIMIERDNLKRYLLDNLLLKVSKSIKRFNALRCTPFKVLMASHKENPPELYYIHEDGNWNKVEQYQAIGSGSTVAEMVCGGLEHNNITMRDFARRAYLAIDYMHQYCPGLGVGVEPQGAPDIKYLHYNEDKDKPASEQDKKEYKKYSQERLQRFKQSFDTILKE
jgi:20S proteasome alpha/beta subunit